MKSIIEETKDVTNNTQKKTEYFISGYLKNIENKWNEQLDGVQIEYWEKSKYQNKTIFSKWISDKLLRFFL